MASLVLEGDDGDVSELLDDGLDDTDSAQVVTEGHQSLVADSQLEVLLDGVLLKVELDGITDLQSGVRESDGSGIVSDGVWDLVGSDLDFHDLQELLVDILVLELEEGEPSLLIVENSVLVTGLWDGDNIYCNSRIPIRPTGNLPLLLTFPSTLTSFSFSLRIWVTSLSVRA